VRRHFGDSVKSTAEFSYVSLRISMVLGVVLGSSITFRASAGHARHHRRPLIVALILGKLRHRPRWGDTAASQYRAAQLRSGLVSRPSLNAGQPFVNRFAERLLLLLDGVAVLLTAVIIVLAVGYYLLRSLRRPRGHRVGATKSAILAYSAEWRRPMPYGYAMIFRHDAAGRRGAIVGLLVASGAG
jgi:putative transport protein